jgi:aryl-alcohol dehydrogenase
VREYDLEHINDGFEDSRNGSVIKPVVVFSH